MDDETKELLAGSLRSLLAGPPADIQPALEDPGWREVVQDDPAAALTLLFTEQGRMLCPTRALDEVVLDEVNDLLPPAARRRAVLYPRLPDGATASSTAEHILGLAITGLEDTDEVLVPVRTPAGVDLALVATADLTPVAVAGFGVNGQWCTVEADVSAPVVVKGEAADRAWTAAVAAARRALSAELVALTAAMLSVAIEHTSTREQYGRPLASYQSVRHRLAEGHAHLTGAATVLQAAWVDGGPWSALLAKASAGHAYNQVAKHCMQLCGAVGLTREHTLHHYVERGAVLDALLGSARDLDTEIGAQLLAGLRAPSVIEL